MCPEFILLLQKSYQNSLWNDTIFLICDVNIINDRIIPRKISIIYKYQNFEHGTQLLNNSICYELQIIDIKM